MSETGMTATDAERPPYVLAADEVVAAAGSDAVSGLTGTEAAQPALVVRRERDRRGEAALDLGRRARSNCATR